MFPCLIDFALDCFATSSERLGARSIDLVEAGGARVGGGAHGADWILFAPGIQQLAQASDVHVHGALVDVDIPPPDAVEQLLAAEHTARMLQEKFQQTIFGRSEIDRSARASHPPLVAVQFDVAKRQHGGEAFGTGAPQQTADPREQFRHRERLENIIVSSGGNAPHPFSMMIGSCLVSGRARSRRHSSMPDRPGSIQSSTMRSGTRSFSRVSASSPRATASTS